MSSMGTYSAPGEETVSHSKPGRWSNSDAAGREAMNRHAVLGRFGLLLAAVWFLHTPLSRGQERFEASRGVDSGNYNMQQTMEAGYRSTWIDGNQSNYGTFVNLNSGPRVLDYTLSMRSIDHHGTLFDGLYFTNFGYGGDPNNVSRLRIDKNKWYDLQVMFRRDQNFWNYNVFLNPFNPTVTAPTNPATNPSFAVSSATHQLMRLKRLQDYNLTFLPESRLRLRLGYSHNVDVGPAFSTFNGPAARYLLNENYRITMNGYRFGVDFRYLPKTTISYDQILEYDKDDTRDALAFNNVLPMAPGTVPGPVDFGIEWFYPPQGATRPCTPVILPSGFANPNCRAFLGYSRYDNPRNFMPTERLSIQSKYIKNLEMSGSASYSTSDNVVRAFGENINEWTSSATVKTRGVLNSGPAEARMVSVHSNWSAVYSLASKWRIIDLARYDNWRNPGLSDLQSGTLFATQPQAAGQVGIQLPQAQFSPIVAGAPTFASICPGPQYNASTCPQHTAAALPDYARTLISTYLGQKMLSNTIQLQTDLTKRISARIGYLYENRVITDTGYFGGTVDYYEHTNHIPPYTSAIYYPGGAGGTAANYFFAARGFCAIPSGATTLPAGCTLNGDGTISYINPTPPTRNREDLPIGGHAGLAGLTVRPVDSLRIYADFQMGYNDRAYTQIFPRHFQSYKVHATYKPKPWATIDGAIDIRENRNNVSNINDLEHGRTYSFATTMVRNSNLAFNLGYSYTDLYTSSYICFRNTGFGIASYAPCAFFGGTNAITLGATSFYSNQQHFAYGDVMWKPFNRVQATVGYSGTFAGGDSLFLNPRILGGTLAFNYQKPFASIQIDLFKGLSYKATWNYYGYNLKTPMDPSGLQPIGSEDFNGSTATFAARYTF